jgi:hypothetical protein
MSYIALAADPDDEVEPPECESSFLLDPNLPRVNGLGNYEPFQVTEGVDIWNNRTYTYTEIPEEMRCGITFRTPFFAPWVADNVTAVEINVSAPTVSDVYVLLHVELQNGGYEDALINRDVDAGFYKLDKPFKWAGPTFMDDPYIFNGTALVTRNVIGDLTLKGTNGSAGWWFTVENDTDLDPEDIKCDKSMHWSAKYECSGKNDDNCTCRLWANPTRDFVGAVVVLPVDQRPPGVAIQAEPAFFGNLSGGRAGAGRGPAGYGYGNATRNGSIPAAAGCFIPDLAVANMTYAQYCAAEATRAPMTCDRAGNAFSKFAMTSSSGFPRTIVNLLKLFTLDGLNFASPEDSTVTTSVDMSCAGGFGAPEGNVVLGQIDFLIDVALGYQTGLDLVTDFPANVYAEAPKMVQLDVSPELGAVYPVRGVVFSTQKKFGTNISIMAWTTRAGWLPVLRPTRRGNLSIFYRDQAWRREPPLRPWTQAVYRPPGGATMFAITGPKGFNDAGGGQLLHLSEVALLDASGVNIAKFDNTKSNNAVISWAVDPDNMQFNPYADHEYLPVAKNADQRQNKILEVEWVTDGMKSGDQNVLEWEAPAPTGDQDKESGSAIQGEALVQLKFQSPVDVRNVTVYTTAASHIWNGSVLLAYADGLWRPLIKNFTVIIDNANQPHPLSDPAT